jgi:hypothetical protein
MDGNIEQICCIKLCVKFGLSANETLEMFLEAFGEYPLSRTAVFDRHSRFKAFRVSNDEYSCQMETRKTIENDKKFENSSSETIAG